MGSFEEKSQQSLIAAGLLYKSNIYASTVNRAYYGFHQYMMHVLFVKMKKTEEEFENDINFYNEGTHNMVWKLVGPAFAKINLTDYKWLQAKIAELKKQRILADYKRYSSTSDDAKASIDNADSMINVLKKSFK